MSTSDRLKRISRQSFGVRNRSPWLRMLSEALHQFHENDLFTSAAAMSYFGLMTLFPALLLLLALSNQVTAGTQMISHVVQVYPGSGKFLRETIQSLSGIGPGVMITCGVIVLWAGSWVFTVVERALNQRLGHYPSDLLHGRALTLAMIGIVSCFCRFPCFSRQCSWDCRKLPAGSRHANWKTIDCWRRSGMFSGRYCLRWEV
jgi:uncharacterized BrkB/YihY/UPF0761 family membrane protein